MKIPYGMKSVPTMVLACLFFAASAYADTINLTQWTHAAPIDVPVKPSGGLVEAELPPEVLAAARVDLADVRLIAPSGDAAAYVVRVDRGETGHSVPYHPARLYNYVFTPHTQASVTADFGGRATRSRVDVSTPGTNFRRRVMVEASNDDTAWQVLRKSDWLFRIAYDGGTYDKSQVNLPDNDFRYLRITVFNAPDDPEQMAINDVTAWQVKGAAPGLTDVPLHSTAVSPDSKLHATEIEVDLGYENIPLWDLSFAFEDVNFLRRVEVLGRNVKTRMIVEPVENAQPRTTIVDEPWQPVSGGTAYRLPTEDGKDTATGLTLPLGGEYRYLLIRIYNADDPPLRFTGLHVRRLRKYVAFRAEAAGGYKLYFGNAQAGKPQYDLEQFADRLRAQGVTAAVCGPVTGNASFAVATQVTPWSERYAWLLWVALLAVGAMLGGLLWRQARAAKAVDNPPPGSNA